MRDLEYGYRVPRQVMELAAKLLPIAAPEIDPPVVVRDAPEDPELVEAPEDEHPDRAIAAAREYAGRGLSVGIVCPDQSRHLLLEELEHQNVKWNDGTTGALGQGINLVSPVDAKGLEFDAVVVLSPHVIVEEDVHGYRLLYIALTRTTRYLTVVHDGDPLALNSRVVDAEEAIDASQPALPLEGGPVVPEQLVVPVPTSAARAVDPHPESTTQDPVERATKAPETASSTSTGRRAMHAAVVSAAADSLAEEVRASLPEHLWPQMIDELRRRLGVAGEDLLDFLD